MASTTEDRQTAGTLAAAISNAVVRITAEYTGRGPTKARSSIRDDLVVVLMQDTLTKGERNLRSAGESELVAQTRVGYQKAMQDDFVAAIQTLTGRKVIAFMSANHMDPDMSAELFVLEPSATHTNDSLSTHTNDSLSPNAKSDRHAHERFDRDHPRSPAQPKED
jgi:uncharacterized protein YbcI